MKSESHRLDDAYLSFLTTHDQTLIGRPPLRSQLHRRIEALMSSLTTPPKTPKSSTTNTAAESPSILHMLSLSSRPRPPTRKPPPPRQPLCSICADYKDNDDFFPLPNCPHRFCNKCVARHLSTRIRSRKGDPSKLLRCPGSGCPAVLDMDSCRKILSEDVVTILDDAICESMIEPRHKFYCPYKDCSALLVKDKEGIKEAECLVCRRLVCAQCSAPWHTGMNCEEYARLGEGEKEDLLVHELAKKNLWRRCSVCRFYVEKKEGCIHIVCRCGHQFCYNCGESWGLLSASHACLREQERFILDY